MSAIGEAIEKVETALAASRKAEGGVQRKAEELRTQAKEAGGRARGWQMKLRSLRLHTIEDDDDAEEEEGTTEDGAESSRRGSQSADDVTPSSVSPGPAGIPSPSKERTLRLPVYTEEQLAGGCLS